MSSKNAQTAVKTKSTQRGSLVTAARLFRALSVFAACTIVLPSTANAEGENLYVEFIGGVTFVEEEDLDGSILTFPAGVPTTEGLSGDIRTDMGFNAGAAIGMRLFEHFRAEVQLSYRQNNVNSLSSMGETSTASGRISLFAAMVNAYYDLHLGIGLVPYAGVGIGYGITELDAKNQATQTKFNDEDSVFVWNVMAGASYPVTDVIDISLGYRYIATEDVKHNGRVDFPTVMPTPKTTDARFDSEYDAHEVTVGIRFNF